MEELATGEPEQIFGMDLTDGVFPLLGVTPALGRTFNRADCEPGAPDTIVLTYGYWQHKLGGDRSVIGRTLTVDGKPHQIIVTFEHFVFLDNADVQFYLPMQFDRAKLKLGNYSFEGVARLKPGVTIERANSDVGRLLPVVIRSFPPPEGFSLKLFDSARIAPLLRPLKQDVVGDIGGALWILMGSISACFLSLARTSRIFCSSAWKVAGRNSLCVPPWVLVGVRLPAICSWRACFSACWGVPRPGLGFRGAARLGFDGAVRPTSSYGHRSRR